MRTFDAIVVGLGAMGSATAWQLARRGAGVLGLDRMKPPHSYGSTHGETRLTRIAVGEGEEHVALVRRSHEIWRELERDAQVELLRQNGLLIYGDSRTSAPMHGRPDFFDRTRHLAERCDVPHEVLDATAIRHRFPQFRVNDSDRGYFEPGAGMVFPWRCVDVQLALARSLGAELHFDERVAEVRQNPRGGVHVRTDAGVYEARAAVVSAGPWIREFLPDDLARQLTVQRQVMAWFEPMGEPSPYLSASMPNFIRLPSEGESLVYGFPRIDASVPDLKVATEREVPHCDPDEIERTVSADERDDLHAIGSLALELKPAATRAECCLYTMAPESRFLIDRHPNQPDVVILSPCSGHGFKHSAAIGECAAAMALRQPVPIDVSPFGIERERRR